MIKVQRFVRKPFYVDAVQVTAENMEEAAKWCDGIIISLTSIKHIKVEVKYPLTPRQTMATINDWIVASPYGYKVFSSKNFLNKFVPIKGQIND